MVLRDIHTCTRCRESKRRCDKSKPSCSRCLRAGITCHYPNPPVHQTPLVQRSPSPDTLSTPTTESSGTIAPEKIAKRRIRACFSCTRCHRLKVRCDKSQPACGRCSEYGYASTCIYTHRAQKTGGPAVPHKSLVQAVGEDPDTIATTWFLRQRGSSHWRVLLSRFDTLASLEAPPFAQALLEHRKGSCLPDFTLPGNYPFGSAQATKYADLDNVYGLIQRHRADVDIYLGSYFTLYQPIYPLLDEEDFRESLKMYWDNPKGTDLHCLARFLVTIGLGIFASTRDIKTATGFFYAGEACLAKTPYMFRPTVVDLQTLCLMIVAKQIANATCWSLDSCWNMMGTLVRLAVMLGLHQGTQAYMYGSANSPRDMRTRNRLWTIIVYLDVQLSLVTGQPFLLPGDALLVSNDAGIYPLQILEECWNSVLPESLPIICHFLRRINSSTDEITYDEAQQYDMEIRQIMGRLGDMRSDSLSRITLDIFFRRVLLCLHRRHALDEEGPTRYPSSYWGSLECSLALLVHLRDLADENEQPRKVDLVRQPFMLDFFSASITASMHLLRTDGPLSLTITNEGMIPPRQTILETLKSCIEIFEKEKEKSLCIRAAYCFLSTVFDTIPGVATL